MEFRNIEAERIRLGVSQGEFCERLHISVKSLNNYTKGRTPISSDVLIRICEECNCSSDYILGLSEKRSKA